MEEFFFCLAEPAVLGVPLLPVGLQGGPGLRVVAAAVGRSLSLAVPQKHVGSSRQEESEETEISNNPVYLTSGFKGEPFFGLSLNPRSSSLHTIQAIFPSGDVQRRVSVDVDGLQVAVGVKQQLGDLHAAGKRCPVKANVFFLKIKTEIFI